ncbi:PEP-CTERM sorting domain-containing protein [Planctomycetes bacterium CA13]
MRFLFMLANAGLLGSSLANAATFANYLPARHDRFSSGVITNPTFLMDHSLISGVDAVGQRAALISPQHYLTAAHISAFNPTFLGSDGALHNFARDLTPGSRTVLGTTLTADFTKSNGTVLLAGTTHASDIAIVRLAAPIPTADGIDTLPIYTGTLSSMVGEELFVFDKNVRAGKDTIDIAEIVELNTGAITASVIYGFDEEGTILPSDELRLVGGDSGGSSLIDFGGRYEVVGANMGVGTDTDTGKVYSFNTFAGAYMSEIESIMNADGYVLGAEGIFVTAVPEPATFFCLAMGMVVIATNRRRINRQPLSDLP